MKLYMRRAVKAVECPYRREALKTGYPNFKKVFLSITNLPDYA
jgi:hypothetical protein